MHARIHNRHTHVFSVKQKEYHAICDNLNATGGYAKWNKSDKENLKKNTISYHLYVLSLKLISPSHKEYNDGYKGWGREEMKRSESRCKLSVTRWKSSEDLMCSMMTRVNYNTWKLLRVNFCSHTQKNKNKKFNHETIGCVNYPFDLGNHFTMHMHITYHMLHFKLTWLYLSRYYSI